jgi:hypothetical protein
MMTKSRSPSMIGCWCTYVGWFDSIGSPVSGAEFVYAIVFVLRCPPEVDGYRSSSSLSSGLCLLLFVTIVSPPLENRHSAGCAGLVLKLVHTTRLLEMSVVCGRLLVSNESMKVSGKVRTCPVYRSELYCGLVENCHGVTFEARIDGLDPISWQN